MPILKEISIDETPLFVIHFYLKTEKNKIKNKQLASSLSTIFFVLKGSKAQATVTLGKQYKPSISPAHISAPYRMHGCICCIDVVLPPERRYSDRL